MRKVTANQIALSNKHVRLLVNFLKQLEVEQVRAEAQQERERKKRVEAKRVTVELQRAEKKRQKQCRHTRGDGSCAIAVMGLSNGERAGWCPNCGKSDFSQKVLSKLKASSRPIGYESEVKWQWFVDNVLTTRQDQLRGQLRKLEEKLMVIPEYCEKIRIEEQLTQYDKSDEVGRSHTLKTLRNYLALGEETEEAQEVPQPPPNGLALDVLDAPANT